MKFIPIDSCLKCPHKMIRGEFLTVSYVPWCIRTGRDLPYMWQKNKSGKRMEANATGEIPDWCPLGDLNESVLQGT